MNPNELRIGNLFHPIARGGKIHLPIWNIVNKVVALELFEVRFVAAEENAVQVKHKKISYSDCSRIELTETWLLKFGFEYITMGIFKRNDFAVIKWEEQPCEFKQWNADGTQRKTIYLKYVHQLQNLHFALTDEELTIKK